MSTSPLRWGICTAGEISHDFAASLQGHEDTHPVVAVASRSIERSQKFADKFKIPTAYSSYDDLANDPNVDIVYIGSVNSEHPRLCKLFLNKKKNVLCEKPLSLSLKETQETLQIARESGVFFMEAVWTRFFPVAFKIRELVLSGKLGDIKSILINFGLALLDRERTIKRSLGGGALYDMGIYLVQMVTMILGAPTSTKTHGSLNDDGVDANYTTVMLYPNNVMATLSCTYLVEYPNEVVIAGSKGRLRIPNHFWAPTELEWTTISGEMIESFEFPLPPSTAEYSLGPLWSGMLYEADAVKQALAEGKKQHPLVSWEETERIATIMEQARTDLGVVWLHEEAQK